MSIIFGDVKDIEPAAPQVVVLDLKDWKTLETFFSKLNVELSRYSDIVQTTNSKAEAKKARLAIADRVIEELLGKGILAMTKPMSPQEYEDWIRANPAMTLKEAYEVYRKNNPHATKIEDWCLEHSCEGDIYRGKIATLEKRLEETTDLATTWQHRAERAESLVEKIIQVLKDRMIFKPVDSFQWGYRSGLLAILDVIKPPEDESE